MHGLKGSTGGTCIITFSLLLFAFVRIISVVTKLFLWQHRRNKPNNASPSEHKVASYIFTFKKNRKTWTKSSIYHWTTTESYTFCKTQSGPLTIITCYCLILNHYVTAHKIHSVMWSDIKNASEVGLHSSSKSHFNFSIGLQW